MRASRLAERLKLSGLPVLAEMASGFVPSRVQDPPPVRQVVDLCDSYGRRPATVAEARALLNLPAAVDLGRMQAA